MIKVGSDFSGVGAFNQALNRLGIQYNEIFACDMDKYARQTFIHNYGEPEYYPTNVYEREIPKESLDIYMTSPPCQAFSLAGKRLGKNDKRGILFFNSLEFIEKNKPRFFIFENVKGLLSDDGGRTFSEWVNFLGGKSVNGAPVLFPYADAVEYHLYYKVLNAKHHGVPQNRERVFLIGIRDDKDNNFSFPAEEHLTNRLKDVLESEVDEKYFLSEKMVNYISKDRKGNNNLIVNREIANTLTCCMKNQQRSTQDNYIQINSEISNQGVIQLNQSKESGGKQPYQQNRIYDSNALCPALNAGQQTWGGNIITLPNNYHIRRLTPRECFRLMDFPDSFTWLVSDSQAYKQAWRGRVAKGVAQTIDTQCNQGVMVIAFGRSEEEKKRRKEHFKKTGLDSGSFKDKELIIKNQDYFDTLLANPNPQKEGLIAENYKIRRLTPRECFRLMDFPDTFTWPVSDSQAYKQAGNSIVVNVLYKILKNLNI